MGIDIQRILALAEKAQAAADASSLAEKSGLDMAFIRAMQRLHAALDTETVTALCRRAARVQYLEGLALRLANAVIERRLGPGLRGPGWMDREAALMQEIEAMGRTDGRSAGAGDSQQKEQA